MDLSTSYLGLDLKSPLVASASPLSESLDSVKQLEDNGASAVVLPSLFEEQFALDTTAVHHYLTNNADAFTEAQSFFPEPDTFHFAPDRYLQHLQELKQAVDIPVIASLNGNTMGGWVDFSVKMAQAGADAIELNIYSIEADPYVTPQKVEQEYLEIVRTVSSEVDIPVAVKLGPYFSNIAYTSRNLAQVGAKGLVLFNRFYQPDIDLETLSVVSNLQLSNSNEIRLPMTWIGILFGRIEADLAATSGVHSAEDVIKLMMVGASVTMLASALLKNGIGHLKTLEAGILEWMETHEYESIEQMRGSMSQLNCADPGSYERAQYIQMLTTYHPNL